MNSRFRLSSKKLSLILAVSIASVLIITVSVLTVALAMSMKDDGKTPVPPIDENIGENGENENQTPDDDTGSSENGDDQQPVAPVPDTPKWSSPVEGYVSKQHSTEALVYSLTLGDYRVHKGIDVSAPVGSEVKACFDGTIENII